MIIHYESLFHKNRPYFFFPYNYRKFVYNIQFNKNNKNVICQKQFRKYH